MSKSMEKGLTVKCKTPFCKADVNEKCVDEVGRPVPAHHGRKREAKRVASG